MSTPFLQLSIKEMEQRVKERIKFLREVIIFMDELLREHGTQLRNEEHSCHTRVTREIKDFGGFGFYADTGKTEFGGNTFRVTQGGSVILDVEFKSEDDFQVTQFPQEVTKDALIHLIAHKADVLFLMERAKGVHQRLKNFQEQEREKQEALIKKAKALCLQ